MEKLVMLSQCASGLGFFLLGVAAIWFVAIYTSKEKD